MTAENAPFVVSEYTDGVVFFIIPRLYIDYGVGWLFSSVLLVAVFGDAENK